MFSLTAHEKPNSKELILACKNNNASEVSRLLNCNRYLVFDFDHYFMTPLHWACKRNHYEVVKVILFFQPDVSCQNIVGQTPVYFAATHPDCRVLALLFYHKADPWSNSRIDLNKITFQNQLATKMIKLARKVITLL